MQVRRSVNLHESSAPAENVLRDTTGSLCESDVVKNENAHNLHHAFLGHYFQTLKNLSPLLKITAMPPPKKRLCGFTAVYLQPSLSASQECSDQNMMDSFHINPRLQSLQAAPTDVFIRTWLCGRKMCIFVASQSVILGHSTLGNN